MWPWNANGANHTPVTEREPDDVLRRRLDDLNERQDRFERVVKELRLEWDEMYDKMRLLLARLSKRIKDAAQLEGDSPQSPQDAPGPTKDRLPGYGHPPLHERATGPRRNY